MYTQTVPYTDFNDKSQSETIMFNISKAEMIDNPQVQERLEKFKEDFEGKQELDPPEVRKLLDFIKRLMEMGYGEKSPDGRRFVKNDAVWTDFKQSAVYDAFLLFLFTDIEQCFRFMLEVFPQDFVTEIMNDKPELQEFKDELSKLSKNSDNELNRVSQTAEIDHSQDVPVAPEPEEDSAIPAWKRENRQPTNKELQKMSKEEMLEAFKARN